MADAKNKYDEYRKVVDGALAKPSDATVKLKVDRSGDAIKIAASAETKGGGSDKDAGKIGGSKLKLRLVLVEEVVRYVGGMTSGSITTSSGLSRVRGRESPDRR